MRRVFLAARWAVAAAGLLLAAACATQKPQVTPPPAAPAPLDASYDWHVLVVAPFGGVFKDIPLAVHEVLLFRDTGAAAAPGDDSECYAVDGAAPRFIARTPTEYLLCFKHDRLSRIEATVRLPRSEAQQTFADACGLWMRNAPALKGEAPKGEAPKDEAPKDEAPKSDSCGGADRGIAFAARIAGSDEEDIELTIQLDAADPEAAAAAEHGPGR
jgi:hypothetical protein